jgi:hypothetical protein
MRCKHNKENNLKIERKVDWKFDLYLDKWMKKLMVYI